MFNYKTKYLKYKTKYLNLKNQLAGRLNDYPTTQYIHTDGIGYNLPEDCYKTHKIPTIKNKCSEINNTVSDKNKYFLGLLIEPSAYANCSYNKSYIDILRYSRIHSNNIFTINNNSKQVTSDCLKEGIINYGTINYSNSLIETYKIFDKYIVDIINDINSKQDNNNSIVLYISSHGSLINDKFVSLDGSSNGEYTNVNLFISHLLPLLKNKKIKNIIIIADFCYAGLRLTHKLKQWCQNNIEYVKNKNISFITLRPIIYEIVVLALIFEFNPTNITEWNILTQKHGIKHSYLVKNFTKLFSGTKDQNKEIINNALDNIKRDLDNDTINTLITKQSQKRFNYKETYARYSDDVLSNQFYKISEEQMYTNALNLIMNILANNYTTETLNTLNATLISNFIANQDFALTLDIGEFGAGIKNDIILKWVMNSNVVTNINNNELTLNDQPINQIF